MTTRDKAERNAKALELHLAGVSFARIAQTIGLASKSAAFEAVKAAREAQEAAGGGAPPLPEDLVEDNQSPDVADAVRTDLARLDAMLTGLWPRARQGDVKAVDRVLKIGERRQALLTLLERATRAPASAAAPEAEGEGVPGVGDIAAARARRIAAAEGSPRP